MNPLAVVPGIVFLLAYGFAVYDRILISDWLMTLMPL